jgi:hypothetical protein
MTVDNPDVKEPHPTRARLFRFWLPFRRNRADAKRPGAQFGNPLIWRKVCDPSRL